MKEWLIVGFHADTGERYADYVRALSADEAEAAWLRSPADCDDIVIVGVVGLDENGRLAALDTATHIAPNVMDED